MLLRGGARGPAGRAGSGSGCERRPVNRSHTAYNATRLLHFWGVQDALPGRTVAGGMGHGWVSTTRWWFHPGAFRAQRHPASAAPSPRPRRHHSQFQRRSTHGGLGGSARPRRGDVRFLEAGFRPTREGRRIVALSAPTSEPPCIAVVVAPSPHYSPLSSASWSTKRDSLINESSVAAENVSAIWRAADFFLPADCANCATIHSPVSATARFS